MNYRHIYLSEAQRRLLPPVASPVLTMEEVAGLPPLVRHYLVITGSVGKPKILNFRALWEGSMKRNREARWMKIRSQQYNFFEEPARLFFIQSSVMGIPFEGLHIYSGVEATMQVKLASLFRVVDAKGEKMSRGETVTLLNDMCLLAPGTLVRKEITWEPIDDLSVKAIYTNRNVTVSAILIFNDQGVLINFISGDRFYCADGKTYLPYKWSTPIRDYKDIGGRKVPGYGEAVWHTPDGDYSYARFFLKEIEYNCTL